MFLDGIMVVKTRKMQATLENKLGFVKYQGKRHEKYKLFDKHGVAIVETLVSRGARGRDITKGILAAISKRIHLTSNELAEAVDCSLSREDYYRILRKEGFATSDLFRRD